MMGGREYLTPELLGCLRRTDGGARAHFFASALGGIGVDQKKLVETSDKPLCLVHGEGDPLYGLITCVPCIIGPFGKTKSL